MDYFDIIFYMVMAGLYAIAHLLNLTYEMVNVAVWYTMIPLFWMTILSRKYKWILWLAPLCFIPLFYVEQIFQQSVVWLQSLGEYNSVSVLVCVYLPIVITLVLARFVKAQFFFWGTIVFIGVLHVAPFILWPLAAAVFGLDLFIR